MNASSGRDAASVKAKVQRGEETGITAFFENVSCRKNTFHSLALNDKTRDYNLDKVNVFSVPRTPFTGNHQPISW